MKKLLALLVFAGAMSSCFAELTKCPDNPACSCDEEISKEVEEEDVA